MKNIFLEDLVFEVIKEIPKGYRVWNIGRNNFKFKGYVPLCLSKNFNVDVTTLKAFKMKSEEKALIALKKAGRKYVTEKELKAINESEV